VRSRTTAGQAALDYLAAIALVAVVLLAAPPAVGTPAVGAAVARALRHAVCVAGGDVCESADARRAGLAPCPLRSDTTGGEGSVTAFSVEVGGRWVLTVTLRSDGSVSVVRTAAGSAGVSGGPSAGVTLGPVAFTVGAEGALRARLQAARGWEFPDAARARRFLEHAVAHSVDDRRWPWAWEAVERAGEASAAAGISAGGDGAGGELVRAAGAAEGALGLRLARDGSTTTYRRVALTGPQVTLALLPAPVGAGSAEWSPSTRGARGASHASSRSARPSRRPPGAR